MSFKDKIENWLYEDNSNTIDLLPEDSKVIDFEEDEELASKARKSKILIGTAVLAAAIIIAATQAKSCNKNEDIEEVVQEEVVLEKDNTNIQIDNENPDTLEPKEGLSNETSEVQEVEYSEFTGKEVDYSKVSEFYNHIKENRNNYGTFAESFQSEDDVKNLVNFIYMFDELYNTNDTTINSQEMFDEIIRDYYSSCVKCDVKGELHLLYKEGTLGYNKLNEVEDLTYILKNGQGNDYSIANQYYEWLGKNLCDKRTAIEQSTKNAPLIDLLREQYEEYRNVGNMLDARKYQKNDSLNIDPIEIYYAYQFPEDADVESMNNSFSCPDWGIDNVVSKYEETSETKLVQRIDNAEIYYAVTQSFEDVLNKGKTR